MGQPFQSWLCYTSLSRLLLKLYVLAEFSKRFPVRKPRKKPGKAAQGRKQEIPAFRGLKRKRGHLMLTWEETLSYTKKKKIGSFISPLGRRNVTDSLPWVWRMVFKRMFRNLTFWNENSLPRADKCKESSGPGDSDTTWTCQPLVSPAYQDVPRLCLLSSSQEYRKQG